MTRAHGGGNVMPHSGEDRAMSDPELAARAQRAAERLEQSWDRWRRLHGPAAEQAQPVSSYVGYSLAEPWGRPRVVFGVAAEEAERLSDLLEANGADPRYDQGLLWGPELSGRPALQQVAEDRDEEPGPADAASLRADL